MTPSFRLPFEEISEGRRLYASDAGFQVFSQKKAAASHEKQGSGLRVLQHRPENRNQFSESTMHSFNRVERPLCIRMDARRSNVFGDQMAA